jgi:hypothetical protein
VNHCFVMSGIPQMEEERQPHLAAASLHQTNLLQGLIISVFRSISFCRAG